ncbi:MAG TPA: BON domain-containing protein [Bryobacteraceae bacterium]
MKRFLASAAMAATLLASAGWADQNTDNRISDQVRIKLAENPDVKGGALDVTVHNGVVVLKGRVDTAKGKRKATKLAHKVKGVKKVENDLKVGPPS